jgi:hypothetical protein
MSLYGPLAKLEEERRQRRLQELELKWQLTIRHMEEVQKVNEETYRAKKAVMEAAVTRRDPPRNKELPRGPFKTTPAARHIKPPKKSRQKKA